MKMIIRDGMGHPMRNCSLKSIRTAHDEPTFMEESGDLVVISLVLFAVLVGALITT